MTNIPEDIQVYIWKMYFNTHVLKDCVQEVKLVLNKNTLYRSFFTEDMCERMRTTEVHRFDFFEEYFVYHKNIEYIDYRVNGLIMLKYFDYVFDKIETKKHLPAYDFTSFLDGLECSHFKVN